MLCGFRCTAKWISYTYTYIHCLILDFFPMEAIVDYWVPCAIYQVIISYLFYIHCAVISRSVMSNSLQPYGL